MLPAVGETSVDSFLRSWSDYAALRKLDIQGPDTPRAFVLSYPLTLHYGLSKVTKAANYNGKDVDILYMGPAPHLELTTMFFPLLEEFVSLIPNCCGIGSVRVWMVGPDVPPAWHETSREINARCHVRFHRSLLHACAAVKDVRPLFAIACNAAVWGYPTWAPTLAMLVSRKVPIVLTEFHDRGLEGTKKVLDGLRNAASHSVVSVYLQIVCVVLCFIPHFLSARVVRFWKPRRIRFAGE